MFLRNFLEGVLRESGAHPWKRKGLPGRLVGLSHFDCSFPLVPGLRSLPLRHCSALARASTANHPADTREPGAEEEHGRRFGDRLDTNVVHTHI